MGGVGERRDLVACRQIRHVDLVTLTYQMEGAERRKSKKPSLLRMKDGNIVEKVLRKLVEKVLEKGKSEGQIHLGKK